MPSTAFIGGRSFWYFSLRIAGIWATTILLQGLCFAQAPPADGSFLLVCTFYGEANQGERAWNSQQACQLPPDFPLDDLYRQQTAYLAGGGASSNISTAQIPPGIHVEISGGHYWSVNSPISLSPAGPDGRRTFTLQTYCGPATWPGPGCNIKVNVYARKRQSWLPGQEFFGWTSVYARNKTSTILLRFESEGSAPDFGSGVIVSGGRVLTAKHLLPAADKIRKKSYLITGLVDWEFPSLNFARASELSIEYVSKKNDFAILKFVRVPPEPPPIFYETAVQATEPVMVLAYPGGGRLNPVTGIASGDANSAESAINATLGRGSSGGPVFSATGGLLGIVTQGPTASDPGKLAFFLRSSAIIAELPASTNPVIWPNLPATKSSHLDTLSLTGLPSTPNNLDFSYPIDEQAAQADRVACCEFLFESQRGMKITSARFVAGSGSTLSLQPQIIISTTGDRVSVRLPFSPGTSHGKFIGYLWTHQVADSH
jgi:S1-C subfamily serine protease